MAFIRTWTRLEPRARGDDLSPSLEARIHDPAWLIGRQWQLGELVGEDTGTPIHLKLQIQSSPIVACGIDGIDGAFEHGTPIDCLAGSDTRHTLKLIERAEAGAELLDRLRAAGCSQAGTTALIDGQLVPECDPRSVSSEGAVMLALCANRLPDGLVLGAKLEEIARTGKIPADLELSIEDAKAIAAVASDWIAWQADLIRAASASSWSPEQLEHHFTLAVNPATGAPFALTAPAWDGEPLDWYDLDVDKRSSCHVPQPPGEVPAGPNPQLQIVAGLPAPLTYPGMPNARWWQFEDSHVNFARVSAQPDDLARMLVVEFASVFGNDWYVRPVELPLGALHTITEFQVTDTFNDTLAIQPIGQPVAGSGAADLQLFRLTEQRDCGSGACDGLLLLPSLVSPLQGEILEDVHLLRDEIANLAWAVEKIVPGQDNMPIDRHSAAAASGELLSTSQQQPPSDTSTLAYRFATDVPMHWFPLAPELSGAPKFHMMLVNRMDNNGVAHDVLPCGDLLTPGLWVWQEEVPREGARVTRRYMMARGDDGKLNVWINRRSSVGQGEGSSGLRYDEAGLLPGEP